MDFRALNKSTMLTRAPLPRMDEMMDRLRAAKYFTKIDLRAGYWQLRIAEENILKTAFRTNYAHFEFLVMPMGLSGAPGHFMSMTNQVLAPYINRSVQDFLDDILIYSKSPQEHVEHVGQVLQAIRDQNLYAKLNTCQFGRTVVEFLGTWVSGSGIQPVQEKLKAIQEWPGCTNVHDARYFLGMCSFNRRFIQNFSTLAGPLTDLSKANRVWVWTAKEQYAFSDLKQALCEASVLVHPDECLPWVVATDASQVGVGGVHMQQHEDGLHPIAFENHKFSPAESRYPVHEFELLAVVYCLKK